VPYLQIENISKRYGSHQVLNDLTMQLHRGELLALLGPNGAGKSTTINILCGLIDRDEGTISGEPCIEGTLNRQLVGYCPQELVFWPDLTLIEQLAMLGQFYGLSKRNSQQRSEHLLNRLGLWDKRASLAKTLSGGMKRRLNLAMALVHDPELIVLDEPEAGLDPQSRILVREYIQALAKSKTVLLTTHNMDEVDRLAQRIILLDQGCIIAEGSPKRLKEQYQKDDLEQVFIELTGRGLRE